LFNIWKKHYPTNRIYYNIENSQTTLYDKDTNIINKLNKNNNCLAKTVNKNIIKNINFNINNIINNNDNFNIIINKDTSNNYDIICVKS